MARCSILLLLLWLASPALATDVMPRVQVGAASVVYGHTALSGSVRVQWGRFYLEPEYLALFANDHTDQGPLLGLGFSGKGRIRPHLGLAMGPVEGLDSGLFYLSAGVSFPAGSRGLVITPELRTGLLGESGYGQAGISLGWRRPRR
jgi:hypothetical protein